ncbi:MAG: AraC family transcriptional regulator [Clostridia bacterium]|nr:AraC family transcriptional regulator [Clostridia bacterium]
MKLESDRRHLLKYYRYFITTLLIAVLSLSGIQYIYTDNLMQKDATANSQNTFTLIRHSHDVLFQQLERSISGLFQNAAFENFGEYYRDNAVNRMCAVYDQLCSIMQSSDLIQNIVLYYPTEEITISTNQSLCSLRQYHGRDFLLSLDSVSIVDRKAFARSVYYALATTPIDVVSIVRTLPVIPKSARPTAYVVIDLKLSVLASVFEGVTIGQGASLMIFDESGTPLSISGRYYPLEELIDSGLPDKSGATAYRRVRAGGEDLFVFYGASRDTGWTYVYVQNTGALNERLVIMRNASISICLGVLLLGLILAWVASRRLYMPLQRISNQLGGEDIDVFTRIDEAVQRNEQLDQALQNNVITGRNQQLLQQMLMNLAPNDSEGGGLRLEPGEKECALFLVGTDSNPESFSNENLAQALAPLGLRPVIKLYTGECEIAFIVAGDSTARDFIAREKLRAAAQAILTLCNPEASIGVSNGFADTGLLSEAYHQASDALGMRLVRGAGSVCCFFEIRNRPTLDYPYRMENAILRAFKTFEIDNVRREVAAFEGYLVSHDATASTVRDFYTQLICSFQRLLIETPSDAGRGASVSHRDLLAMTSVQDMSDYLLNQFAAMMESREKSEGKSEIIDQVCAYIEAHVKDAPTVDTIASEFYMSVSSLRAEFQRVKGVSIKSYTDQVRLDMARRLLQTSGRRVQDIAADLGFNYAQSFIAFFKNATGMTPGEYRARVQSAQPDAGDVSQPTGENLESN